MTDELRMLIEEKKQLERRIKMLTTGSIENGLAKIDRICCASKYQRGKWALFYKYKYYANTRRQELPVQRTKWETMFNGETLEEVVEKIPEAIKALQDLYEAAKGENRDDS